MEPKKIKLKVHSRNFSEEELIVNCEALTKEKWEIRDGDLLEIFPPDGRLETWRSHLILQVKTLSPDVQAKGGPFSILQDIAVAFTLTGVREVHVRKVDCRDVGLDLVELSFKDQYITRSDMWRITCALLDRCLYSGKHLEHSSMRMQTHCLWFQGEKVTSGAVVSSTRVVFRSASAQVFLFIQISSEMWDFDPNGEFFFDKTVSGFLRDLFVRWREAGCNHDVTIVFFWRLHYDLSSRLPVSTSVREDRKRGIYYEDFFRVIVESTSNSDWSCELINIKKSFLKLRPLIHSLPGRANAELCKSEEGNILEAINLALNVLERQNVDTNLQLSGQQIVVLTAGTGYFEIDRQLMQLTNERLVYGGVTTDVVSMRDQPLHAMPMFKFHSKEEEFFSVPHWINYSFYNSPQGRQTGFQPRIYLSDHLVNTYLQKENPSRKTQLYNPSTANPFTVTDPQIPSWVDYDQYDDAIFDLPNTRLGKVHSSGRMAEGRGRGQGEREHSGDSPGDTVPVTFEMGGSHTDLDPFDGPDLADSASTSPNSNYVETKQIFTSRERQFTRSLAPPPRQRYKSENFGDAAIDKLGSSGGAKQDRTGFVSVGSAEALRQAYTPWGSYRDTGNQGKSLQKKRLSFSNPFDPNKMHSEAPAFRRRWVHVFPTNKRGVAFQTHHAAAQECELEGSNSTLQNVESVCSTPRSSIKRKGILKHTLTSDSGLASDSRSGSFKNESFMKTPTSTGLKLSPVNLSPRDEDRNLWKSTKKQKGSPYLNGSSIAGRDKPILKHSAHNPTSSSVTPESMRRQHERWNNPFLSSDTENFASVRRTGVDWMSLVEPAHLPITTDFYPAKEILDRDYAQYNTNLVVFREEQDQNFMETSSEKKVPVWYSDHSTMNTFQAFLEMISQRLSQGFQVTYPPLSERSSSLHHCRDLNSVYVLHEAVERLKVAVQREREGHRQRRPNESVTVHMGRSHVFQKLVLSSQDISVFIYRQKSPLESHPCLYAYQLSSVQDEQLQAASSQFAVTSDEYNWNFLDHHVCGYSDFEELGESLRYWELRYLLLPKQCPTLPPHCGSSEQRKQEEEALISNFVRFLEFLNRIKKGVATRRASTQSLIRQASAPVRTPKNKLNRSSFESQTSLRSLGTSPSPTPTPPPPHSSTMSRSRQLSEIEEEEEKKRSWTHEDHNPSSSSSTPFTRNDTKNVVESKTEETEQERGNRREKETQRDRGEKGGISRSKSEAKSVRERRRQSSAELDTGIRKVRSRENLLQVEQGSRSRPESPSLTPRHESSKSLSVTPHRDMSHYSPRTERKKIINKLKKIASEQQSDVTSDVERDKSQPQQLPVPIPQSSSVLNFREKETDIESTLDYPSLASDGVVHVHEGPPAVDEPLHCNSPLDAILQAMESENDGVDFLGLQSGLQKGCFIAMDAVRWIVENVRGIYTRKQAAKIMQSMIIGQMVVHASRDPTVPFLDGYFFYCMTHKEAQEEAPKDILNSSYYIVNRDFDSFSKKWFEAEIKFPSSSLVADSDSPSSPHPLASSLPTKQPYYMHTEDTYVPPSILNRRVELNPDPHFHSSRPEWCYVHYDPVYNPSEAFQLKFQWMVTTTNLLSTLIQSWVRHASMCDFNLVAVPLHKSLLQDHRATHPFRKPSFIPLSLPAEIEEKWRDEEACCVAENMRKLLLAVAGRNGFLQDCAVPPPDHGILSPHFTDSSDRSSPDFHIHHTGTALVQLVVDLPGAAECHHIQATSPASSTHNHNTQTGSRNRLHSRDATSTPLTLSPVKPARPKGRLTSDGRDGCETENADDAALLGGETRCGFYWHRNYLLPKQKNVPPGLVSRYDEVLEKFTEDCRNIDRVLIDLCDSLFPE